MARTRKHDWPELLAAFIEQRRARPFEYGTNDCLTFAADAAVAITGEDPAAPWRGAYSTEAEVMALAESVGGVHGLIDWPRKPAGLAQRGDIVLAMVGERETFGVAVGGGYWAGPGEGGAVLRPMSEVVAAVEV